jgi:hypothetical protein
MTAMNYKSVFTRDRRPKLAAHRLRELWKRKRFSSPFYDEELSINPKQGFIRTNS